MENYSKLAMEDMCTNNDPEFYGALVSWSLGQLPGVYTPFSDKYLIDRLRHLVWTRGKEIRVSLKEEVSSLKSSDR